MNKEKTMRFFFGRFVSGRFVSGILPVLMLAAGLAGCVSEKSFDEVSQQLQAERAKSDAIRKELDLMKKENAGLASQIAELNENTGSGDSARQAARVKKLLARIAEQDTAIKSLKEKNRIPEVKKPDMAWAKSLAGLLSTTFKDEIRENRVQVETGEDRMTIRVSEPLLFERDGVDITVDGEELLTRLGELLQKVKDHEMVVGAHLDTTPIAPVMAPDFPTAWDFTGARAIEVVRYLQEESKISGRILSATAYGSARPVASNTSEAGRSQNRRVEITILA